MQITAYSFGRITIDGTEYDDDVVIAQGRVFPEWWRKEGHEVSVFDIVDRLDPLPARLIVGTGAAGACQVLKEVVDFCRMQRVELIALPTPEAVAEFNALSDAEQLQTVAAMHVSC